MGPFRRDQFLTPETLAVRAAGEVVLLDHLRKDDRQAQCGQRQIETLESQGRDSHDHADGEAEEGRYRDGREERPVVIGDEYRCCERTGTHERAVSERYLTRQTG